MTTSLQRILIILFVLKLILVPMALTIAGGGSISDYESKYYDDMLSGAQSNSEELKDNILESSIDPDKEFQNDIIGSSRVGIKKTFAGNLLSTGFSFYIPADMGNDELEKILIKVYNIFSILITLLAGYELFQIIWTKKNS